MSKYKLQIYFIYNFVFLYIYIYYCIFYEHLIYILLFLTVFGFTKFLSTQKGKYKIGKYNKLIIRYK